MSSFPRSRTVFAAFCLLIAAGAASPERGVAQALEDVVYLNDGSVIRGTITEQIPGESVLIRTRDGNVLRFSMDRIERITKEASAVAESGSAFGQRNPAAALGLSFLLNGAGQFYNGEGMKGLLHLGLSLAAVAITMSGYDSCYDTGYTYWDVWDEQYETGYGEGDCTLYGIGVGSVILTKAWSMYDAYVSAQRINRDAGLSFHVEPGVRLARERGPRLPSGLIARPRMRLDLNVATIRF